MAEAVIVSAVRTPIGRAGKGVLKDVRADDLAAVAVKAAVERVPQLDRSLIEDVILGCAFPEGEQGMNLARLVGALAGLQRPVASPSTASAPPACRQSTWQRKILCWDLAMCLSRVVSKTCRASPWAASILATIRASSNPARKMPAVGLISPSNWNTAILAISLWVSQRRTWRVNTISAAKPRMPSLYAATSAPLPPPITVPSNAKLCRYHYPMVGSWRSMRGRAAIPRWRDWQPSNPPSSKVAA